MKSYPAAAFFLRESWSLCSASRVLKTQESRTESAKVNDRIVLRAQGGFNGTLFQTLPGVGSSNPQAIGRGIPLLFRR